MSREESKPSIIQSIIGYVVHSRTSLSRWRRIYANMKQRPSHQEEELASHHPCSCRAMPCHAMLSCSRACRPVARCPGQNTLIYAAGYARGISPPSDHENVRDCLMPAQPYSTLNQSSEQSPRITGHRPGKAGRSPSCVALQQIMPVSISGSGHFGSARAWKQRAEEVRSGSSFLNVVPPVPVPVPGYSSSALPLDEKTVACSPGHLTVPTSALPAEAPPSSNRTCR